MGDTKISACFLWSAGCMGKLSRKHLLCHCLAGKMLIHRGGGLAGARGACGLSEHGQAEHRPSLNISQT